MKRGSFTMGSIDSNLSDFIICVHCNSHVHCVTGEGALSPSPQHPYASEREESYPTGLTRTAGLREDEGEQGWVPSSSSCGPVVPGSPAWGHLLLSGCRAALVASGAPGMVGVWRKGLLPFFNLWGWPGWCRCQHPLLGYRVA